METVNPLYLALCPASIDHETVDARARQVDGEGEAAPGPGEGREGPGGGGPPPGEELIGGSLCGRPSGCLFPGGWLEQPGFTLARLSSKNYANT